MTKGEQDKAESVIDLIKYGSSLAGGTAGASIGALTGGPAGAILGALGGTTLTHVLCNIGVEISGRFLSKREKMRIGAVYAYAIRKIKENIENGQQIRQDGFLQGQPGERSAVGEILEGTLIAAQRDHEEKKLPFYANLLANIPFHPEIDRSHANFLIRLGQDISYRQMCLLAIFSQKDRFSLRSGDFEELIRGEDTRKSMPLTALLQEVDDLNSKGLLNCFDTSLLSNRTLVTVRPAGTKVEGMGAILYDLMELSAIDVQELNPIAEMLR